MSALISDKLKKLHKIDLLYLIYAYKLKELGRPLSSICPEEIMKELSIDKQAYYALTKRVSDMNLLELIE